MAPDCGLKYLPRDVAYGKMKAMADGAAVVQAEGGQLGRSLATRSTFLWPMQSGTFIREGYLIPDEISS